MKIIYSKILKIIFASFCILSLISCNVLKQPSSVPEHLDYTREDIVENEINQINEFIENEPVRALWRSLLLGKNDVIINCIEKINSLVEESYKNKDFILAQKYYNAVKIALDSGIIPNNSFSLKKIDFEQLENIPGLAVAPEENNKAPLNIEDCINATCTIWVDRGVKVEKGAGFADIIIGSGFFIDKRGYLVTNHHVIESMVDPEYEGFSRLYIKLPSDMDTKIPAKVIGYDSILDLALLKVEIDPEFVLNLGSSDGLRVGDKVSAIGTPVGLEGTLTSGIISATGRKLLTIGDVFQLDAAVNAGNSGGPLIDKNMFVQAIVFAGMPQFQGLNFAIPVEYLKQVLPAMYQGGSVVHPWIGAFGHTKKYGNKKSGLEIQYVLPGSSAFLSGLQIGDVITEINGEKVNSLEDFHFIMLGQKAESIVTCKYIRELADKGEETREIIVYLDKRPKAPTKEIYNTDFVTHAFIPLFGMELVHSSTLNKNSFTITKVLDNSPADELSFSPYDIIEIRDVSFDDEDEAMYVQVYTKRQKKGFFDIVMGLGTQYDSPYYF